MTTERFIRELRTTLTDAGLSGSFLVRDLDTGEELGIDPEIEYPLASLVKIPLAMAVAERIADGRLDGAGAIDIEPEGSRAGRVGLGRFRHPARVAIEDLLYLTTAVSDNIAADALFALVPPDEVQRSLHDAGVRGITVRHTMSALNDTPAERLDHSEVHLAHALAIGSGTSGRGHAIAQLDTTRANAGTARACVDLLAALWRPSPIAPAVATGVRALMAENVNRNRLAPDFSSDASAWSSKTGTLLNLRHEIGVVEHDDGDTFAVAALTESRVPASIQPPAEATMAQVARALHDRLRDG